MKRAFNWIFLITSYKLLKLFSVVCEFGSQANVCKNYIQNICSVVFLPTVSWQATELFYGAIKIRQSAVDGMTRRTLVKVCQWSVTIRFDAKNQRPIEKIHQISYWWVLSKPFCHTTGHIPIYLPIICNTVLEVF